MKTSSVSKLSRNELKKVLGGGGEEPMHPLCPICSCEWPYPSAYLAYASANLCEPNPCARPVDPTPNDPDPCAPAIDM
ncbi:hypothetical protein VRU48_09925 [Pedobacter sp. KR3-3]|uniref:Bacteriocin-type signal sequence-containing protein n=1 Tax=Pedobacter albus TaxID=3113905 RepID=A0ABU7I7U0_9SPHI|nr:hypothetical protein [Pedobacter sp. KR3-3]MEE1945426.1 hypothetical protein [Pedobacter sp. KR3-3]